MKMKMLVKFTKVHVLQYNNVLNGLILYLFEGSIYNQFITAHVLDSGLQLHSKHTWRQWFAFTTR